MGLGAGIGSLCIMYVLLFAVILFGFRSRTWRPGVGIRLASLSAFVVAFVSLILEVVPLGKVGSPALFAIKVTGRYALQMGSECTYTGEGRSEPEDRSRDFGRLTKREMMRVK